jgi:hypothetical protein
MKNLGARDFYKSYPCWEKMAKEQKKTLAWFRSIPDDLQGIS